MDVRLSYDLSDSFPPTDLWPSNLVLEHSSYSAAGSTLNIFSVHLAVDHQATHVDTPYRFYDRGKRIVDFPIGDHVFDRPLVVYFPTGDAELIAPEHLIPFADGPSQCDLLLLRTVASRHRFSDWIRYAKCNPAVSGEAICYLIDSFDGLRAVGVDAISMKIEGSCERGFAAHRAFLGDADHTVLLIEGVNLDFDISQMVRVMAPPVVHREGWRLPLHHDGRGKG